jgi:hypothetical protein
LPDPFRKSLFVKTSKDSIDIIFMTLVIFKQLIFQEVAIPANPEEAEARLPGVHTVTGTSPTSGITSTSSTCRSVYINQQHMQVRVHQPAAHSGQCTSISSTYSSVYISQQHMQVRVHQPAAHAGQCTSTSSTCRSEYINQQHMQVSVHQPAAHAGQCTSANSTCRSEYINQQHM